MLTPRRQQCYRPRCGSDSHTNRLRKQSSMPSAPTLTRRVVAFTGACAAMAWSFGSSPVAQTKPPADRFTVTLAGAIGKTAAYAALKIDGDQVSGTYAYARLNQPLTLAGRRASGGRVTLDETDGSGR